MKNINKKTIIYLISAFIILLFLVIFIPTYSLNDYTEINDTVNSINFNDNKYLISGYFNDDKTINSNKNYISIKAYYKLNNPSLRINTQNENIRIIIKSYDANYKYIETTDLGNGDYFTKNSQTAFILLSIYKVDNLGNIINTTYNDLLTELQLKEFEIENISDINTLDITNRAGTATSYLNENTFLNTANFRIGYYYGGYYTAGKYTYDETRTCSRNYYKVLPNTTYYISANDSRYNIQIDIFTPTGTWKKEYFDWKGGSGQVTFTSPDYESIVGINITSVSKSNVNGADMVFKNNFKLNINPNKYTYNRTPITEDNFTLNDKNSLRNGAYGYYNNDYYYEDDIYCSKTFIKNNMNEDQYIFKTSDENYQLRILEYNDANELLSTTTIKDERTFTFNPATTYFAYEIINAKNITDTDYIDYFNALDNGLQISFTKYEKYVHNTVMKDVTAEEQLSNLTTGWNLGNSLESSASSFLNSTSYFPSETYWGNPYVTENLIKHIKSLGFNNIRIPVTWGNNVYQDSNGNYVIRQDYLSRVQDVVDYAIKNGMYVVINSHFDSGKSTSPISVGVEDSTFDKTKTYAKEMWTQIANYFKDYDEHLMFESYNEVDNRAKSRACSNLAGKQMNEINQIFVDTVRATGNNNEKRILMVQTFLSITDDVTLNSFENPKDIYDHKIIVQVHSYPEAFDEQVEDQFEALDAFKERTGLPVVVGEFGTTSSYTPSSYRYISVSNYIARAKEHNILVYVWDNGSNYSFINRRDFSKDDTKMLNAIFNPVKYTTGDKVILNSFNSFKYQTLNQTTGELMPDKYWGSLVSNDIAVDQTKDCALVELSDKNAATGRLIHFIFFYDANGNFLKSGSYNNSYPGTNRYLIIIPKGATTMRIGINCSTYATKQSDYQSYFDNNDLEIRYKFINLNTDRTLLDEQLTSSETMISDMNDFTYASLSTTTGALVEDKYWGSLTTDYLPITDGATLFNYRWTTRLSGNGISVHYIDFYDENHTFIANTSINDGSALGKNQASLTVPTGAKYVKLGLNATSSAHKISDYAMILKTGDATLIYSSSNN